MPSNYLLVQRQLSVCVAPLAQLPSLFLFITFSVNILVGWFMCDKTPLEAAQPVSTAFSPCSGFGACSAVWTPLLPAALSVGLSP